MPRIPFVPADIAEPREIVDAVRARRGGTLLDLDRMLLHSPELTAGWNAYLGAVRTKLSVPPRLRELAICGVAALNGAEYEFVHHAPLLLAEGATPAQVEALRDMDRAAMDDGVFGAAERAVLALTIGMTRHVKVPADTFREARAALGSDRAMVELVAIIATYNMVSRFLVALDVQP
jgi:alkylhydroperoxidase family enzyme